MRWKEIQGHTGRFVSDSGLIKRNGVISNTFIRNGYPCIRFNKKNYYIHRLVASSFIKNPQQYPVVNHIDGDKLNNHISNLEWCTHKQNVVHAFRNGLMKITPLTGVRNGMALLTDSDVLAIRAEYSPGITLASLGKKYGVNYYTISDIVKRKTWKHI